MVRSPTPAVLRHVDDKADFSRRRSSAFGLTDDGSSPLMHKTATVGIVALALRNKNERKKEAEFKVRLTFGCFNFFLFFIFGTLFESKKKLDISSIHDNFLCVPSLSSVARPCRPSNSHGFLTARLTVSGVISRSHGLTSKSHVEPK